MPGTNSGQSVTVCIVFFVEVSVAVLMLLAKVSFDVDYKDRLFVRRDTATTDGFKRKGRFSDQQCAARTALQQAIIVEEDEVGREISFFVISVIDRRTCVGLLGDSDDLHQFWWIGSPLAGDSRVGSVAVVIGRGTAEGLQPPSTH